MTISKVPEVTLVLHTSAEPVTVVVEVVADPILVAPVPVLLFKETLPDPVGLMETSPVPVVVTVKLVAGWI